MAGRSKKGQPSRKAPPSKRKASSNAPRKGSSSSKRPKEYRKFDDLSKKMRESVLSQLVSTYFEHLQEQGKQGKKGCRRGFVGELLEDAQKRVSGLGITRDDFDNAVRKEKARRADASSPPTTSDPERRPSDVGVESTSSSVSDLSCRSEVVAAPSAEAMSSARALVALSAGTSLASSAEDATSTETALSTETSPRTSAAPTVGATSCAWPGCELSCSPESCATCKAPVHRLCEHEGEASRNWAHHSEKGELHCPKHHPSASTCTPPLPAVATTSTAGDSSATQQKSKERNKGGRPVGTDRKSQHAQERAKKLARNYVVVEIARLREKAEKERGGSKKRPKLENGTRERLVEDAKQKFGVKDKDFDVPRQTISDRIKAERLEVFHPGHSSPVLVVETILKAFVFMAHELLCPMNKTTIIALMNSLLHDSVHEARLIKWKRDRGMYASDDEEADLVGLSWYRGFLRRNSDIESKKGTKLAANRRDHCTFAAFKKMYNQAEKVLLESGNAVKLESPVHMNKQGIIVEDQKDAFGHPVTIDFRRPENCFCCDECGDNTHGKDDGNKGGEQMVGPAGEVSHELVGIKNSHFSVLPISDFRGRLRFVVVIFAAEVLYASWTIGVDVFADAAEKVNGIEPLCNFGPGQRYPGLSLFDPEGKEIPVMFAATPKASMTSAILKDTFKMMDDLGISQRGVNEDGTEFVPFVVIDGHPSRMGEDFLRYVNEETHRWKIVLGAPYGTGKWQFHDDKRQNGMFKMELVDAKRRWYKKKELHGLPPEILPEEIVVVLYDATKSSFMVERFGASALCERGWVPFNRSTLDDNEVLATAPSDVKRDRTAVLQSRGVNFDINAIVPSSQRDLLGSGSGLLAGGPDAASEVARAGETVNLGATTNDNDSQ
ncbi:hypothetical protein ACHAWF_013505 [Thalassiosira exigua]